MDKIKCPKCQAENPDNTNFCGKCGANLYPSDDAPPSITRTMIARRDELTSGGIFAERYHIIEDLGKGGMGKVYKALDTKIHEKVALKILNPEVAADQKNLERFHNELKITRKISHRNICRVFDLGEHDNSTFISMEYVSGEDLKTLIRRVGQLSAGKSLFIIRQVCEGLNEAHRLGVVHRDLKPHNIMIDREGNAKIMDFGIAHTSKARGLTDAGVIMGTPEYMSPEQVEGKELDSRSDLYSLGVIFYEMLTGRTPFSGDTPITVAVKQKTESPIDPRRINTQIPENISRVILKCLEKERDRRYQKTVDLLNDLKNIERGLPPTDRVLPESKTRSGEITVKFNLRKLFVPAMLVVAAVLTGLIGWNVLSRKGDVLLASGKPSLAVMHFENNTGDDSLQHWRKALSDLLIADLSQSKFLQVLSPERQLEILEGLDITTASSYSSRDLKNIAERSGVRYILVGKMTMAGDIIRLNTTLQDVGTDKVIGSEQVEGSEETLFNLVDDLTTKIKESFKLSAQDIAGDIDAEVSAITSSSMEAQGYYTEGLKYHNNAAYDKSIPLMQLAVAIDPEFAMAYRAMAIGYANLGYKTESAKHLQKAFELSDRVSDREKYYIQAEYYRMSDKTLDKAIDAYDKLLQLYPDDSVGNNNLGILFMSLEEWDKALERFRVNVRNKAPNYFSYSNMSNILINQEKFGRAAEILQNYIKRNSDHPEIRKQLAMVHLYKGEYELALKEAEAAYLLNPTSSIYYNIKGAVFYAQGKMDESQAEFQKLLETDEPIAHYSGLTALSSLSLAQGKSAEAMQLQQQGMELAEMLGEKAWMHDLLLTKFFILYAGGRYDEAIAACEQAEAIAIETASSNQQKAVHLCRGLVYSSQKNIPAAQNEATSLKLLIEEGLNQKEMRLYHLLSGLIDSAAGNHSAAIEKLTLGDSMMNQKDPMRSLLMEALATAYFRAGDLDKAQDEYEKLSVLPAFNLEFAYFINRSYYQLGKIFQQQKMATEARENYARFLELWAEADLPEARDAREQLNTI